MEGGILFENAVVLHRPREIIAGFVHCSGCHRHSRRPSSALNLSVNMQYIQCVNSLHSGHRALPVATKSAAEDPGQRYSRGRQSQNKAFNALAIDPFTEINSEILTGPESHFEKTL